jgi:hypothetical protein
LFGADGTVAPFLSYHISALHFLPCDAVWGCSYTYRSSNGSEDNRICVFGGSQGSVSQWLAMSIYRSLSTIYQSVSESDLS